MEPLALWQVAGVITGSTKTSTFSTSANCTTRQPKAFVTVTEYEPGATLNISSVVAPLLHKNEGGNAGGLCTLMSTAPPIPAQA
ncbi:MAG TPA: hypothetical protein PK198_17145, partial [Saprospiraceae bacterium]|nr:hypothetical protein [Saprospiraceae bacterium]